MAHLHAAQQGGERGVIDRGQLAAAFAEMDEDGSGTLDIDELGAALRSQLGLEMTADELGSLIKKADVDGDGILDLEEFCDAAEVAFASSGGVAAAVGDAGDTSTAVHPAREIFDRIDADGSGTIDMEELGVALRRMGRTTVSAAEIREVMDEVDMDGDGQLDFDEFRKAGEAFLQRAATNEIEESAAHDGQDSLARAIFDKIDVDGSGTIDMEELGQALELLGKEVAEDELGAMMDAIDADGSGEVNFEEFKAVAGDFVPRAVYRSVNKKALVRDTADLDAVAVGELHVGEIIEARAKTSVQTTDSSMPTGGDSAAAAPPGGGVAEQAEPAPGTQIHVRGLGVDGWDGTPEGTGTYETEAALRSILQPFGTLLQATIRHRIEGPSGKWDPKVTPAAEWPAAGSKNSSWALVTMGSAESVDAALVAGETSGLCADIISLAAATAPFARTASLQCGRWQAW
jgi:Ca2+-binding EF-hand superfamily protein